MPPNQSHSQIMNIFFPPEDFLKDYYLILEKKKKTMKTEIPKLF